jgi:hypothetical protein
LNEERFTGDFNADLAAVEEEELLQELRKGIEYFIILIVVL